MTFIPLPYYALVFFQFLLIIVLGTFFKSFSVELTDGSNLKTKNSFGVFLMILVTLYIGLRPISGWFGDMIIYSREFNMYKEGLPFDSSKDFLFEWMKYFYAKFLSEELFFFTCALFYVVPLYFAAKKIFKDYWFYAFLMLVVSFTFWAFGTNGIRNGMASSIFLYGLSREKRWVSISILMISCLIHKSMMLPFMAYVVTLFYNKPKSFLYFWFFTIPLSLVFGGIFQAFFLKLGIIEEKALTSYLAGFNQASEGVELNVGFRWDFILYSASGVFSGWYFIFKKNFNDTLYKRLYSFYLIVNGFWILIIKSNYSNRFAYLSWFILGIIIIYPLLKNVFFKKQHVIIGFILFFYFAFGYVLNVLDALKFIK